jgi:thiol-disulfide isomerase/thioredoxin
MATIRLRRIPAFLACGLLAWSVALAADRAADKIIAEIDAITVPAADSVKEPAEKTKRQKLVDQKSKLIMELYKASPTNPELVRLMPERWKLRPETDASDLATKTEIKEIQSKNKNPKLVAEASFYRTNMAIRKAGANYKLDEVLPSIEDFIKRFPKDERGGQLLYQVASASTDKGRRSDIFARIQKDYPDSPTAKKLEERSKMVSIPEDVSEMVGMPFILEFTDAIKGSPVSIEGLKGKVVVIDFWATWCGPCVDEMPNMKKLYAEFKDKGVEFIGVSLDQSKDKGGLDSLKSFVAKNQIEWPQYYQGNFWQSEFSSSWHINSIPCVFLVDADGKLASVKARGELEKLIPKYLEKAKKSGGTTTASTN